MYEIKKGVPMPPAPANGGRPSIYPFAQMVLGDSFDVPVPKGKDAKTIAQSISGTANNFAKRTEAKFSFSIRVMEDGKFIRVWAVDKRPPRAKRT